MALTRLALPLIRVALFASGMLESVLCAVVVAELAGYWLHRLLHSEKLPLLSRSHMSVQHRPLNRKGFENALSRYTLSSLNPTRSFPGAIKDRAFEDFWEKR